MSKFKGLLIFIEVALVGLVILYIAFGRKNREMGKEGESLEEASDRDNDYRKPDE